MMMMVLVREAKTKLQELGIELSRDLQCHELIYADDTLLIDD